MQQPQQLFVRLMSAEDVPAAAALERECFSEPWSEQNLYTELANPQAVFFIAELAGAFVGYAGLHFALDEGYIDNVAVSADARRQGVGDALIDALCGFSYAKRLAFLTLEARASNAPAIALYQKHGFAPVGLRKGFYAAPTEDAVLMTKYYTVALPL